MDELTSEANEIYTNDSDIADGVADSLSAEYSDNSSDDRVDPDSSQNNSQTINMEPAPLDDEIPQLDDGTIAEQVVEQLLDRVESSGETEEQQTYSIDDIYVQLEDIKALLVTKNEQFNIYARNMQLYSGVECGLLAFIIGGLVIYSFLGRIG